MTQKQIHLRGQLGAGLDLEGWLEGDDRVFVSLGANRVVIDFKVFANSAERHQAVEVLLSRLATGEALSSRVSGLKPCVDFLIRQSEEGAVLMFSVDIDYQDAPLEFEIGDIPPALVSTVLLPKWSLIEKHALLDYFTIQLSIAGTEIGPLKMMGMADHEEAFEAMSQDEFDGFMMAVVGSLARQVYVVKIRMRLEGKGLEQKILKGDKDGS